MDRGLSPLSKDWFREEVGEPTALQLRAWAAAARGDHSLIISPTGTGKTLAAFLWSLDRLITGAWPVGSIRVLYVSPLKALNNDVQRNLVGPLERLRARVVATGQSPPDIRVVVRSGDTARGERSRMLRRPPEILITTPESLNLLVSSLRARPLFAGLRTVILDEIHAVASGKRGTHLITAVERLVPLAGEFQRIALSATVRPTDRVAVFVGGYRRQGGAYRRREVKIIDAHAQKALALSVQWPEVTGGGDVWQALAAELRERIRSNRSTLAFVNSRRAAEKISRLVNEGQPRPLAYPHHGSLSRELRAVVEERMKSGDLPAIVATSTTTKIDILICADFWALSASMRAIMSCWYSLNSRRIP